MKVYHVNNFGCPAYNPFLAFGFAPRPYMAMAPAAPKVVIEYSLKKIEDALVFQVTEQSQFVTDFLKTKRFQASNGMIIASDQYPELKDSTNHIYLRGSDSVRDLKIDVTRFVGKQQRDNKAEIVKAALKEFAEYLAKAAKATRPAYWS